VVNNFTTQYYIWSQTVFYVRLPNACIIQFCRDYACQICLFLWPKTHGIRNVLRKVTVTEDIFVFAVQCVIISRQSIS